MKRLKRIRRGKTVQQILYPHRDLLLLMGLVAFFFAYLWNVPGGITGTAVYDDINISLVHAQSGPSQQITNYVRLSDGIGAVEEVVQMPAEVGKPVRWVKHLDLEYSSAPGRLPLPSGASTVTLTREIERNFLTGFVVGASDDNVTLAVDAPVNVSLNVTIELPEASNASDTVGINPPVDLPTVQNQTTNDTLVPAPDQGVAAPVPVVASQPATGPILVVYENVSGVAVVYETEAPRAVERDIEAGRKEVVISSTVHYENILAFTTSDDLPRGSITVY